MNIKRTQLKLYNLDFVRPYDGDLVILRDTRTQHLEFWRKNEEANEYEFVTSYDATAGREIRGRDSYVFMIAEDADAKGHSMQDAATLLTDRFTGTELLAAAIAYYNKATGTTWGEKFFGEYTSKRIAEYIVLQVYVKF